MSKVKDKGGKKNQDQSIILDGIDISAMDQEKLLRYLVKEVQQLYDAKKQNRFEEEERNLVLRQLELARSKLDEYEQKSLAQIKNMEDLTAEHNGDVLVFRQRVHYLRYLLDRELKENKEQQDLLTKQSYESHMEILHDIAKQRADFKIKHSEEKKAYEQNTKECTTKAAKRYKAAVENYSAAFEDRMADLNSERQEMQENTAVEIQSCQRYIDQKRQENTVHLQLNFERNYRDAKEYFQELTFHNLALIDDLRGQAVQLKDHFSGLCSRFYEVQKATATRKEPVRLQTQHLENVQKQVQLLRKDKLALTRTKAGIRDFQAERAKLISEIQECSEQYEKIQADMKLLSDNYFSGIAEAKHKIGCTANEARSQAAQLQAKVTAIKSALREAVLNNADCDSAEESLKQLEQFETEYAQNLAKQKDMEATVHKMAKVFNDSLLSLRYIMENYNLDIDPADLELQPQMPGISTTHTEIGRIGQAMDILQTV
ncbi:dynein regulatory complex subunit 2-like [Paramacrobiotus metropolitanus]|uniref:dynein regulatory complex subunit 2-like n=1 Tax=Paramacrobiotus metropolitanus TaxID=2943436 RepID=UPI0024463FF1|nr:dynein regulatory complex subunit 2-like [Paramacrobiotus metropolitanus]